MEDEIKSRLKFLTKRIDKLSQESFLKSGYSHQTARLRLLTELVREQLNEQEIPPPRLAKKSI